MVSSRVYPGLERKPGGPDNWVEAAGGLPPYIERIAKHLHYERGFSISHAIATARNTVKRWMRKGKVTKHGTTKNVTAATAAKAALADAQWRAKRKVGSLRLSDELLAVIDLTDVGDDLAYDLLEWVEADTTGADQSGHAILASMDIKDLAQRANQIEDPVAKAKARQTILDLAVPPEKLTADKRKQYASKGQSMPDGKFPVFDETSLKSAIRLARTPQQRAHIVKRARALGLANLLPEQWVTDLSEIALRAGLVSLLDLASTIPPRNARGRVPSDGRKSFKGQGKWKHGFIPVSGAAAEAKSKGSPIAMKRMKRLFGKPAKDPEGAPNSFPKRSRAGRTPERVVAAKGRAGSRHAEGRKRDPKSVKVDEKLHPGSESAKDVGQLQRTPFEDKENRNRTKAGSEGLLPDRQKEASKDSRIPERARQNWNEIPEALKTVRNGKRYVVAEFGGKQYVTEWLGGVKHTESAPLAQRKVMRTLASADAANMSAAELRGLVNNPRTPASVVKTARKALRAKGEVPANA